MKRKPLVLVDGKIAQIGSGDTLVQSEFSGVSLVDTDSLKIPEYYQMINFTQLQLEGDLTIDGDLWLA